MRIFLLNTKSMRMHSKYKGIEWYWLLGVGVIATCGSRLCPQAALMGTEREKA
jgi:hypothetical protein